jgi:uncharacterized protein YecT (DUF1311 family)
MQKVMILACLALPLPAMAQDAPADGASAAVTAAETCTRAAEDVAGRLACVGLARTQCIEAAETPNTIAQSECAAWELDYWKTSLNQSYDEFHAALTADDAEGPSRSQAAAFEAAQKAWLAWREAECTFAASRMRGGSGAGPAEISCELYLTGQRAVEVEAELSGLVQ